jgi:hypothetical protein
VLAHRRRRTDRCFALGFVVCVDQRCADPENSHIILGAGAFQKRSYPIGADRRQWIEQSARCPDERFPISNTIKPSPSASHFRVDQIVDLANERITQGTLLAPRFVALQDTIRNFKNNLAEPWQLISGISVYLELAKNEGVLNKTVHCAFWGILRRQYSQGHP